MSGADEVTVTRVLITRLFARHLTVPAVPAGRLQKLIHYAAGPVHLSSIRDGEGESATQGTWNVEEYFSLTCSSNHSQ